MIKSLEPTTAERIFLFSTLGANSSFLCWGIVDLASTEKSQVNTVWYGPAAGALLTLHLQKNLKSIQYGMDQLR